MHCLPVQQKWYVTDGQYLCDNVVVSIQQTHTHTHIYKHVPLSKKDTGYILSLQYNCLLNMYVVVIIAVVFVVIYLLLSTKLRKTELSRTKHTIQ